MGRTMRWLKRILGGKGENKDQSAKSNNNEVPDRKRWSFAKPRNSVNSVCHYEETKRPCMVLQKATLGHEVIKIEAAVKIQKAFRGHLARKALCALKSLVKLQALVRGYLVRKKMRQTIYQLQSLIRAQSFMNGSKLHSRSSASRNENAGLSAFSPRSFERYGCEFKGDVYLPGQNQQQPTSLNRCKSGFDTSPKIIEMDTCRLRSHSSRLRMVEPSIHNRSPFHYKAPRFDMSNSRLSQEYSYGSKTAMNTPRCNGFGADSPVTPRKGVNVTDRMLRRLSRHREQPSYMADTHSSVAKIRVRSQSVPRWRRVSFDAMQPKESAFVGDTNRRSCTQTKDGDGVENYGTAEYYLDRMW